MERYFVINEFEEGYRQEEFIYEETLFEYCTEVLYIPSEKIEELDYHDYSLEISLMDLEQEDILDDWYVNLYKISIKQ